MVHRIHTSEGCTIRAETHGHIFSLFQVANHPNYIRSIGSDWSKVWSKPRRSWKPTNANQDLSELKATPCEEKWYPGWGFGLEFLLGMISIRRRIWWLRFSNSVIPVFSYLSLKIVIVFSNQHSSLSFTLPHETLWISSCHLFFCGPLLSRQATEPHICIYVVMC